MKALRLVVFTTLLVPLVASAESAFFTVLPGTADESMTLAAREGRPDAGEAPRVSRERAAAMVKSRYGESKILSVNLIRSKGPPVYRVKVLSPGGVVRFVFVDGQSGDVFE